VVTVGRGYVLEGEEGGSDQSFSQGASILNWIRSGAREKVKFPIGNTFRESVRGRRR